MQKKLLVALLALLFAAAPASATYIPTTSDPSTSAKQDTGNTSLSSIDGKITAVNTGAVVVSSSALPTGASTSAKQDTIIGHVDGVEASLSSIDGKITAVNTGAVVVSSSALPSGAATAAKQPALGTAGSASADVISVQGVASMTALKVDGSAVTQPVSGTFWQATQPVSGTITANAGSGTFAVSGSVTASDPTFTDATGTAVPANAAFVGGTDGTNTRALKTDSGGELQVDVLSMPTTTITDGSGSLNVIVDSITAGDNNIGNVDVLSMPTTTITDGSGALNVIVDSGSVTADTELPTAAAISAENTAAPTAPSVYSLPLVFDGSNWDRMKGDSTDGLLVNLGANNDVVVSATNLDVQIGGSDSITIGTFPDNEPVNVAQMNGVAVTMGNGASGTGVQRVTIASDSTGVVGLATGSNAIGKLAANSGVDIGDVDVTSISAGTNNIGQVSVAPQTANGLSVFNATSGDGSTALTNTAQAIKASAGQVYGWFIYNPNATAQYVVFYNTAAASVTVGTTNPLFVLTIPATSGANVEFTNGITFSNAGFSCAAASTAGGAGAPTTALEAVVFYK